MAIDKIKTAGLGENLEIAGTEAAKVPVGTTAQRASAQSGDIRFNSTLSLMEYYDGANWKSIDSPPVITSISPTTETDASANIVLTGSNFQSGATVKFIGNDGTEYNSPTVTIDSSTQITATTPSSALTVANEPYDIIITNASGLSGTLADALDAGATPTWTTAAGNIGTVYEDDAISGLSIAATDADGQSVSITSSDFSITGVTLNSNGTITGTPNVNDTYAVGGVTHTFNANASDGTNTGTRTFNILRKWNDGSSAATALQYGSDVVSVMGGSFVAGKYYLTGLTSAGLTAQQVYVDSDGWMLYYRHAGTSGSFSATYEITGNALGEGAIGTLNSPTQGLTDSGSSTTAGSRGVARLSTEFVRALGGNSASGNVYRHETGSTTAYITDGQSFYTAPTGSGDVYGYDDSISVGSSYAGRRTYTGEVTAADRPFCSYGGSSFTGGVIPFYHGSNYSGGYSQPTTTWHVDITMWVRQY